MYLKTFLTLFWTCKLNSLSSYLIQLLRVYTFNIKSSHAKYKKALIQKVLMQTHQSIGPIHSFSTGLSTTLERGEGRQREGCSGAPLVLLHPGLLGGRHPQSFFWGYHLHSPKLYISMTHIPITWSDLCLTKDKCMSSCFLSHTLL